MEILGFDIGIYQIILAVVVMLIISAIFFRRSFSGLIYDYAVDGALSFADNFLFGLGLIGIDIGDWIAAFLIFKKERKISGKAVALFCAWEATNFLPVSFIPVVGEIVEFFTNLCPTVTITRILFNKYKPAEKQQQKLEKDVFTAEQAGINVSKEREALKRVKNMISKANPVGALKEIKKPIEELSSKLTNYTNELISETQGIIQNIASQKIQAPQELINMLQEGINGAWQLLQEAQNALENEKDKDFETAINSAANAKTIIISAAQQFDNAFQDYQNQMQQGYQ